MTWTADAVPSLDGRVAVVTGANSGIGFETALALAAHGARVVLAVRDARRGEQAAARIRSRVPSARVVTRTLDVATIDSVRSFATEWDGPLHLLVNNAGVMAPPTPRRTPDGFELQFGTNHLGHFVLTGLLLPALLAADSPRVVTVASIVHHNGTAEVVEGNASATYHPQRTYANSKLANLLFALELHRQAVARGLPLVSTAAHPGVSATGLISSRDGIGASWAMRTFGPLVARVVTQSAVAGARPVLFAATEAEPGSYTGPQKFGETRGPIGPARISDLAADEKLGRRLWQASEDLTGLHYPWP